MQSEVILVGGRGLGWCFKSGTALKESGAECFVPIHKSQIQLESGGCEVKRTRPEESRLFLFFQSFFVKR